MEKRRHRRHARRLKVRFGVTDLEQSGFTGDVSATGLFVVTGAQPKIGSRIHVEVTLMDQQKLYLEAVVARLTVVAPELRQIMKGGFGARFLTGAELMGEMVPHLRNKVHFQLTYPTQESFLTAYENELKRGGIFLWTEKEHPVNTILNLEIEAGWLGRSQSFEVRVVHVLPGADGRFGTALMFLDPGSASTTLSALTAKP
jgi:Tfp pilus assembly protein PilZ